MKLFISLFFVAGSLTLVGLLDSAMIKKPAQKIESQNISTESPSSAHPLLTSEVPKRPPFNDEGPGCIRGVTCPNKRIS